MTRPQLQSKSCVVTGAAGFIGARLVERLLEQGVNVSAWTSSIKGAWRLERLQQYHNARFLSVQEVDIRNLSSVNDALRNAKSDTIFHLAAYGAYPRVQKDMERIFDTNVLGFWNILTAAIQLGVKSFINTGSSSEYGSVDSMMTEDTFPKPDNFYGSTKLAATFLTKGLSMRCPIKTLTLRIFSAYGPWEEEMRLVPSVVLSCLRGEKVDLTPGEQVRDFIFVDDVVDAYIMSANVNDVPNGTVLNVSSGHESTIKSMATAIQSVAYKKTGKEGMLNWGARPYQDGELFHWCGNNHLAKKLLNWEPKVPLQQGLAKTVDWFVENENAYAGLAGREIAKS